MITTLILVIIAVAAALVALSPLALRGLGDQAGDWSRLSDIGQTYGAASALLAVLALIGVAVSLWLQTREAKGARDQNLRALHTDLLKMAMEDPVYRRCWGDFFDSDDVDRQREHMYTNLIIEHWYVMYDQGAISEEHLRSIARIVLAGEIGARFWRTGRDLRSRSAATRAERRFHAILDEEYRRVQAPEAGTPAPAIAGRDRGRRWPRRLLAAGTALGAVTAGAFVLRPRRGRPPGRSHVSGRSYRRRINR